MKMKPLFATITLLLLLGTVTTLHAQNELPDEATFLETFQRRYDLINPHARTTEHAIPLREAAITTEMGSITSSANPLEFLYAHGYAQSLSGMQFYNRQAEIARQFTYGPLGNPHAIPYQTNLGYNVNSLLYNGFFMARPDLMPYTLGAFTPGMMSRIAQRKHTPRGQYQSFESERITPAQETE
jgi:hypothetical protein